MRFIFLSTNADVLRERLAARSGHFMPVSLIDSQLEALEPPDANERAWTFDARALPDAIVRDVLHRLQQEAAA